MKKQLAYLREHRQQIFVNLPAAIAYLLSIVSFTLLLAVVLHVVLPSPVETVIVEDSTSSEVVATTSQKLATYGITGLVVAVSVIIFVTIPYYLARMYARVMRRTMRYLKLPATLRQLTLLKLVVFSVPLVVFTVATLVVDVTYTLGALAVANFVCVVGAMVCVGLHSYLVKQSRLSFSEVW